MIYTEEGLKQTQYWVAEFEKMLDGLRQRVKPVNEQKYRIMAYGVISQIRAMREEIDEYIGITAYNDFVPEKSYEPVSKSQEPVLV
jgi:hypothetical protein